MSDPIAAVPVAEITSGMQLFRCVPYSCTMLAKACVTRQAQADSNFPPTALLLCKGCALGAEVKARAGHVEVDPHAAARASRKHIAGLPQKPKPPRALPVVAAAPVLATPPVVIQPEKNEGKMPRPIPLREGEEIAGVKVLRELESKGEGVPYLVRFPCGHEEEVLGFVLRSYTKTGTTRHCKTCGIVGSRKAKLKETATDEQPTAPRVAALALAPKAPRPRPRPRPKGPSPSPSPSPSLDPLKPLGQQYEFPLRRDYNVRVGLPLDLTHADVKRLSRWLELLVFDEGPVDQ